MYEVQVATIQNESDMLEQDDQLLHDHRPVISFPSLQEYKVHKQPYRILCLQKLETINASGRLCHNFIKHQAYFIFYKASSQCVFFSEECASFVYKIVLVSPKKGPSVI